MWHSGFVVAGMVGLMVGASALARQDAGGDGRRETRGSGIDPEGEPERTGSCVKRVGGDVKDEVESVDRGDWTEYRCGRSVIDTPLPVGYPGPTAPGAMEIKHYPSVRRAEIVSNGNEDGMMGWNTSRAFWPLFQHIKDRDIAMTSPVETDYERVEDDGTLREGQWSMSFLYREPEMGETGHDGAVFVYDTDPVTVVSLGVRGDLTRGELRRAVSELSLWVSNSGAWEAVGDARKLSYNGPNVRAAYRWHEVQLPIRKRASVDGEGGASEPVERAPEASEAGDTSTMEVEWTLIDGGAE